MNKTQVLHIIAYIFFLFFGFLLQFLISVGPYENEINI